MKDRLWLNFNTDWLYLDQDQAEARLPNCDETTFVPVHLPHANKVFPHHNFDDREYQFISWYRKTFELDADYEGRKAFIDFDGVMIAAEVYLNGAFLGEHKGGYTPFSFDLTDHIRWGEKNLLAVRVDSTERKDIPPYGGVVDYMTFGGIYRDVRLRIVDPLYIQDVFARPRNGLASTSALDLSVSLSNEDQEDRAAFIVAVLTDDGGQNVGEVAEEVFLRKGELKEITLRMEALNVERWSLDTPHLYTLTVMIEHEGVSVDHYKVRVGFREARFSDDGGFYLNGQPLQLFGLNRHQSYPYVGYAMPARVQRKDADILKYDLGLNIVRTSHYPQSPHFLDRCDEIGLLVLEEIPGWQHIGDEAWKALSKRDVRDMIIRDRNHPSIMLWGVRINESQDDHAFYTDTNRMAHELDPTRPTGGIRCFRESKFLEDVFTYNDFSNSVQEPNHCPYMITEFNGHMFPTKAWDQEERLMEHALRHARIQDKQMGTSGIAGAIGWCAFDYNTQKVFGSGDRICYHGVCDIFRIPKFAGYFYGSQIDPNVRVVLQAASLWKLEKSPSSSRSMHAV